VIDPHELVVKERKAVDTQALEQLGFPDGDARQRHNGYELDLDLADGWSLSAFRDAGELHLCALSRKFAGNEEMGACVVPRRQARQSGYAKRAAVASSTCTDSTACW
jgi:hypothetical protein